MPSEWILNQATMRWQFNRPRNVGRVSELIRTCAPKSLAEWRDYYYRNVYPKQHLEELGRRLYVKVSEVCRAEAEKYGGAVFYVISVKQGNRKVIYNTDVIDALRAEMERLRGLPEG